MTHGEHLADRSAHRQTDNVGGVDAQRVEDGHGVVGHVDQRVVTRGLVTAADAPVVERNGAVARREREALEGPTRELLAQAGDE